MTDVAAWLRGLGLGRYAAAFRDNEIRPDVLCSLTAEDLKEIGVAAVGDRRRLLDAIAALCGAPPSAAPAAAPPPPPTTATPTAGDGTAGQTGANDGLSAERRHLTVLFCDLAGSTALSARVDPEEMLGVMAAYHRTVTNVIQREGGYVAKFLGDGVLAYFGWPAAHEDDVERAVRSGLASADAVAGLDAPGGRLAARVGIATGLVVAGDLVGEGETRERGVVGETPNLAARLQALADPGAVVVDATTRRLTGALFEWRDLGETELKGLPHPVRAWRALGQGAVESRFEALRSGSAPPPLIGRKEELRHLLRRWHRARAGEGQVVLVSGEAGIGKSRLLAALEERLKPEPHTRLGYFCSPHHQDSALFPIINQLERAAGLERGDLPNAKLDKLEAMLAGASTLREDVALVAELLLLPGSGCYPPLRLDPRRKRTRSFEALLRQVERLAERRPMLITFEDLHWIDPSSHELLGLLVQCIARRPVLLVVTFRSEFQPTWTDQPHVTTLALKRLARPEATSLVRHLAGTTAGLSDGLVAEIAERGDGVPLFLEEITQALLAAGDGDVEQARRTLSSVQGAGLSVPAPLHASLLARLDRLGAAAKEVAQIASALGREFPLELLRAVARKPEPELQAALGRLVEAGIVFRRGTAPRTGFLFKHALVQDAAYGTLLRATRKRLHATVANALERALPETVERRPERIARHLVEAGLHERATPYWQRAGELALRRSAVREATAHFSAALACVGTQRATPERDACELEVRLGLGTAAILNANPAHPAVAVHYGRAVELARRLGDSVLSFRAIWGSWFRAMTTGEGRQALALADELVALAGRLGDGDLTLEAYHSRWAISHLAGANAATRADTDLGIALYDPARHHSHAYEYGGHDTGVCARTHNAVCLWLAGLADQAARMASEAMDLGRRLGHPPSLAHACWWSAIALQLLRMPEACREAAELRTRIARAQGNLNPALLSDFLIGWARFEAGETAEGLLAMEEGVAAERRTETRFYFEYRLLVLAECLLRTGGLTQALGLVREVYAFIEKSGNRLYEAEAHRLEGACLSGLGGPGAKEAEGRLRSAVEIAERQSALSLKLRAVRDLARLLRDQGRLAEARGLLAPVYASFTEGFAFPDLVEARTLLEELGAASAYGVGRHQDEVRTPQCPDRLHEPAPGR